MIEHLFLVPQNELYMSWCAIGSCQKHYGTNAFQRKLVINDFECGALNYNRANYRMISTNKQKTEIEPLDTIYSEILLLTKVGLHAIECLK